MKYASETGTKACLLTLADIIFFGRLLVVNPALWTGEWFFHMSFFLVLVRHLRFFLNPVPGWVWLAQTPGLIAGYLLPVSLMYVLFVRLFTKLEKYASPANMLFLMLMLLISAIGLLMSIYYKPDLVDVKLFILGIMSLTPRDLPNSILFVLHFSLVLILIPFLPTHIITAPLVMMESRKRKQSLRLVMHEK